jgi:hypothetical protein
MWRAGKEEWDLLRVGVVDLKNDVFVARLFFGARLFGGLRRVLSCPARALGGCCAAAGCPALLYVVLTPQPPHLPATPPGDPATGEVKWDVDCRPSDATFLAMKAGAPIYVHKRVWEESATRLRDTHAFEYIKQLHAQGVTKEPEEAAAAGAAARGGSAGASGATAPSDLPDASTLLPITLLIRDMEVRGTPPAAGLSVVDAVPLAVEPGPCQLAPRSDASSPPPPLQEAVAEEDYSRAAALRDHPWMRMHSDIETHK